MAWREARIQTSEDALTPFIHPRILAPQSRARSLLWHEDWAREWFHGDEEDRCRQEAIELQAMQKDLVQRQAAEARLREETIPAQARADTPARQQAAPVDLRKKAITTANTQAQEQATTKARCWEGMGLQGEGKSRKRPDFR